MCPKSESLRVQLTLKNEMNLHVCKKFTVFFCNGMVHFRVHKSLQLVSVLSQLIPTHNITLSFY
jgi:hypothetical protein